MKRIDAIKVLNWMRNYRYITHKEATNIYKIWQREKIIDEVKHG